MSFEEGFHLGEYYEHFPSNNTASSTSHHHQTKSSPNHISGLISKIFCQQIFGSGFVHCDPHEANILLRAHPTDPSRLQVILLDHGLYRKLNPTFRKLYAKFWQAILLSDQIGIEFTCREMMKISSEQDTSPTSASSSSSSSATQPTAVKDGLYTLLAAMITLQSWDEIIDEDPTRISAKEIHDIHNTKKRQAIVLQSYVQKYFFEINELLRSVPSDLLLLFKTNDCLRHLDKILHTPTKSITIQGKIAADVVLQDELQEIWNYKSYLAVERKTSSGEDENWNLNESDVLDRERASNGSASDVPSIAWTGLALVSKTSNALWTWFRVQMRIFVVEWIGWYLQLQQQYLPRSNATDSVEATIEV